MARRKKAAAPEPPPIESKAFEEQVESSFIEYAMSVIAGRALPDVRDGLKPVHRRILWSMQQAGHRPDRPYVKCARVVGDVMGRFHPHGDQSIYEALVRMGQPFSMRHMLIDGHGNFGSPSDPPAAQRYTECRLDELAMSLLAGIDEDTVDLIPTYDGSAEEPVVLPARYPNLLVNGSEGIAVGMATRIPPHNLGEVCAAVDYLIDNPEASVDDLMKFIPGPDFPTGELIMGRDGIRDVYETGRGTIRVRAITEVEQRSAGDRIIVTAVPYQTSVDDIAEKAAKAVEEGVITGVRDIRNESAGGGTRLVIELRSGVSSVVVLNNLYKHTKMQTTYGANLVALDDGVPRTLNLRDILVKWLAHQEEVVTRRTKFRLKKAEDRLHIVEGLIKAIDMIDAIIALIKASKDRGVARTGLMGEGFEFSEIQANHILDMPLGRLTQLGTKELADEAKTLRKTIRELKKILKDRNVLMAIIRGELGDVRDAHANERRTALTDDDGDIDVEALVEDEELSVTVTGRSYVKSVFVNSRAAKVAKPDEKDCVIEVVATSTLGHLLLFTNRGQVYKAMGADLPQKKLTAAPNLFTMQSNESVVAFIADNQYETTPNLVFVMASGQVKKSAFAEFVDVSTRRDGVVAAKVASDDQVVAVLPVKEGDQLFLMTSSGQSIRFDEAEARPMGRAAAGVRGIKLKGDDRVVAACAASEGDEYIMIATSTGYAKRTKVEDFTLQSRGGVGLRGAKLNVNQGNIVSALPVSGREEVIVVTEEGPGVIVPSTAADIRNRESGGGKLDVDGKVRLVRLAPDIPE